MNRDPVDVQLIRRVILFLADGEPNSIAALKNFDKICAAAPGYEFQIQRVNVLENYQAALEHNVLVTPCLIMTDPPPRVMVVGTLKDTDRVRAALRLGSGDD